MDVEVNEIHLPSSEIGINIQTLSEGGVDVESQLPWPFQSVNLSYTDEDDARLLCVVFTDERAPVNDGLTRNPSSEADPPLESSLSSEIMMNVWNWMYVVAYPPVDPSSEVGMNVWKFPVAGDEAYPPLNPSSEIGIDVWNWMFVVAYPQVDPSSKIGINVQMFAVVGDELNPSLEIRMNDPMFDEAFPPLAVSPEIVMFADGGDQSVALLSPPGIGIDIRMLPDGSDEADGDPPLPRSLDNWSPPPSSSSSSEEEEAGIKIQMTAVAAGDEAEEPSEVTTVGVTGGEEGGRDPLRPLAAVHRVTRYSETGIVFEMCSLSEAGAELRRWFNRISSSASRFMFNTFGVAGTGQESYPATVPLPEAFAFSGGGDGRPPANGEPPLPPAVDRFMRFRIYASIPAISGTCIHILAGMMEPTTENKKLIGVSMMSLIGNLVASTWLIFRGGDLPNDDRKKKSFKIAFVFTATLTFYVSFSTLAANLFTLPGIALCGALAVGLGHNDGLTRLYKKFF